MVTEIQKMRKTNRAALYGWGMMWVGVMGITLDSAKVGVQSQTIQLSVLTVTEIYLSLLSLIG